MQRFWITCKTVLYSRSHLYALHIKLASHITTAILIKYKLNAIFESCSQANYYSKPFSLSFFSFPALPFHYSLSFIVYSNPAQRHSVLSYRFQWRLVCSKSNFSDLSMRVALKWVFEAQCKEGLKFVEIGKENYRRFDEQNIGIVHFCRCFTNICQLD